MRVSLVRMGLGSAVAMAAACADGRSMELGEAERGLGVDPVSADEGDCPGEPSPVRTLADAAGPADRPVGTAVAFGPLAEEPGYREVLEAELDDVSPENELKWGSAQPMRPTPTGSRSPGR